MMDERPLEERLDEMLAEAAKMAEEEPIDIDIKTTDDGKEIVFSKEHEKRMKKIFSMAENYEKSKKKLEREFEKIDERAEKRHRKIARIEKKVKEKEAKEILKAELKKKRKENLLEFLRKKGNVAMTCGAVVLLVIAIAPNAGAWRDGISQFLLRPQEEYSEFKNVKDNENTAEVEGVKFYYVPNGFSFEDIISKSKMKIITFGNQTENKFFDFKILQQDYDIKVNTENSEIVDISTNERDMALVKNNNEMYITWQDAKNVYVLDGNCDENMLKEIAEKIEVVE